MAVGDKRVAIRDNESVIFVGPGEITGLNADSSFFSAATAADNLFSAAYLGLLALLFATLAPRQAQKLGGSFELGVGLSFIFFAAIAAGADISAMLEVAPLLIGMVAILLTVHAVVTFGLGSLFRLSLPELITASNAAVLGATTAPALAATRGWHNLVTPGVLVGVLGYALGTFLGTVVYRYWGAML